MAKKDKEDPRSSIYEERRHWGGFRPCNTTITEMSCGWPLNPVFKSPWVIRFGNQSLTRKFSSPMEPHTEWLAWGIGQVDGWKFPSASSMKTILCVWRTTTDGSEWNHARPAPPVSARERFHASRFSRRKPPRHGGKSVGDQSC